MADGPAPSTAPHALLPMSQPVSIPAVQLAAAATAALLPWVALARAVADLLQDSQVQVPERTVLPLAGGGSLFAMPASDAQIAITKLITYTPANQGTARPAIQGDVVIFDVATGQRRLLIDGPTVTARRTAAVSLLAAQRLAAQPHGPLLIVGAGVQGHAHLDAFVEGLGVREVWVASRQSATAQALVDAARQRHPGLAVQVAHDLAQAAARCPLIVTCTPARAIALDQAPHPQAFVAAVGAFTPQMAEIAPALCQRFARQGRIVLDSPAAMHEAGDLLQAGLPVGSYACLRDVVQTPQTRTSDGPVLFKSCGWGGWDLAAARLAWHGFQQALSARS